MHPSPCRYVKHYSTMYSLPQSASPIKALVRKMFEIHGKPQFSAFVPSLFQSNDSQVP